MRLFSAHKNKSEMTFDSLVDSYYEPVYRHVRRLVVSHDDACDICQDAFLRALRSFASLRDPASAKAWIYRIATNEALRFLASRKSAGELLSDRLAETLADESSDNEPDPRLLRFNRALLCLTPAQRSVFDLRHYDELSYADIAQIVGGSPDTVRVVYHQAKEKIKKYILS